CLSSVIAFLREGEMLLKPHASQPRHFLQSARLFEQMGGAGDDLQPRLGPHARLRLFVHADDHIVVAANDKQSRRRDQWQRITRQIGTPTARNNGGDVGMAGGSNERRGSAGGSSEI